MLSVLVTAVVAVPVGVRLAGMETREALDRDAAVLAEVLAAAPGAADAYTRQLTATGFEVYQVTDGRDASGALPKALVRDLAAGTPLPPRRARVAGRTRLVAGRAVPGRTGTAVVLAAQPVTLTASVVWRRLWMALLAGLLAGLACGYWLSRRLAGPIGQAAAAATMLSAGDRSVRLRGAGTTETVELAAAINQLAEALTVSEGRQRDFLMSVSHELRTPLTAIRGYAEALADGVVGPDGAQRAGQTMLDEARRLDRLIADLLVLARLEAVDFPIEPVAGDLSVLVADTAEAWGGRCAAAGIPLRVERLVGTAPVVTDMARVRQVLDGLLENALRVVPAGAEIVLSVYRQQPGWVAVEVRDGGPGLSEDDLPVAFERGALYRRYQGVRKVGSGLGLAMAARLAQRLGGRITAGHAVEGGARFTLTLPG